MHYFPATEFDSTGGRFPWGSLRITAHIEMIIKYNVSNNLDNSTRDSADFGK
jgi:hypothetical protein